MNNNQARICKYFNYKHLPENLQTISKLFHDLFHALDEEVPPNGQKSEGMQRLLEAKDCCVRASLK